MGVLEQPGAVVLSLAADELDRLTEARVPDVGEAEVLQRPQDVVVPPGRERELQPGLDRHLSRGPAAEQRPFEQVLLPAATGSAHLRRAAAGSLVLQQAFEDVDRRRERGDGRALLGPAVPSTV